jgi:hypothetical protein
VTAMNEQEIEGEVGQEDSLDGVSEKPLHCETI